MKAPKLRIPLDFPMGLFLGALSVAAIVVIGNAVTSPHWATVYGAVIGGLFAVVAVWGALYGVSLQVRAQAGLLDLQRLARLESERAMLPLALSKIHDFCAERIRWTVTRDNKGGRLLVEVDGQWLHVIKACIEYSDGSAKSQLVDLIAIYQISLDLEGAFILQERLPNSALSDADEVDRLNRIYLIHDWSVLQARCINLFDFARGGRDAGALDQVAHIALRNIRRLCDSGGFSGFCLTNLPDYARAYEEACEPGGLRYARADWRDC